MFDVRQLAVMNHSDILPVKPDGGSQVEDDQYHHHMVGCLVMILQCQAQGYKQVQTTPLLGCCQGNKVPYGENMGPTPMGRLGYITINYLSSLSWFLSTSHYGHRTVFFKRNVAVED